MNNDNIEPCLSFLEKQAGGFLIDFDATKNAYRNKRKQMTPVQHYASGLRPDKYTPSQAYRHVMPSVVSYLNNNKIRGYRGWLDKANPVNYNQGLYQPVGSFSGPTTEDGKYAQKRRRRVQGLMNGIGTKMQQGMGRKFTPAERDRYGFNDNSLKNPLNFGGLPAGSGGRLGEARSFARNPILRPLANYGGQSVVKNKQMREYINLYDKYRQVYGPKAAIKFMPDNDEKLGINPRDMIRTMVQRGVFTANNAPTAQPMPQTGTPQHIPLQYKTVNNMA